MRFFVIFIFLLSLLSSDEIQRIESIVEDITKLRSQNQECKKTLKSNEKKNYIKYDLRIKNLEKQVENYKKLLKTKVKKKLTSEKADIRPKEKIIIQKCKNITKEEPNNFPKLILKDKYSKIKNN